VLLLGSWTDSAWLHPVTHLPVVVLCLISEAFATKLSSEGRRAAVWKMSTTVVLAMAISVLAGWSELRLALIHYPELLLAQVGFIVVISRFLALRLFDSWNYGVDDDELDAEDMLGTALISDGDSEAQPQTSASPRRSTVSHRPPALAPETSV
ncbi:MAG: hypothetical protein KDA41_18730, partial [Planctomycetales bacterium]|nr:hypothetical protein [Planctomycetales bacterium]